MDFLNYKEGRLFAHNIAIKELADCYGTPLYVYDEQAIINEWQAVDSALKNHQHLICYSVKANSNLAILQLLAQLGSGFDIVSQGELERVLMAGGDPKKIVFSGVAKSKQAITRVLSIGIKCFNVESLPELDRINQIAINMNVIAPISIRINPDIDAKTHPCISTGLKENKFGICYEDVIKTYQYAKTLSNINIMGIDCHIGSQLTEVQPFVDASKRILRIVDELKSHGINLSHIDLGGGLGIRYKDETPPSYLELMTALEPQLNQYPELEIILEPGRRIVGNAGILITQVEYLKHQDEHHFAIVDAGMNTLIRSALYGAWMDIIQENNNNKEPIYSYEIVGPICETTDKLGSKRELSLSQDDLLVVCSAGAYGFVLASNYNSSPLPAEVFISHGQHILIRSEQDFSDLWQGEITL